MAMRRNQPNVHAKDLPDSGVTNSASFRTGEKRPITGATTCGSIVTAMASARKPATRLSPASRRKRKRLRCGIAADCSRGFRGDYLPSYGKITWKSRKTRGTMNFRRIAIFFSFVFVVLFAAAITSPRAAVRQQDEAPKKRQTPTIDEYQPKSTLVTNEHKIERAKFPFIDIHTHHWNPTAAEIDRLSTKMDTINLRGKVKCRG